MTMMKMIFSTARLDLLVLGLLLLVASCVGEKVAATRPTSSSSRQQHRNAQATFYDCQFTDPLFLEGWGEDWAEVWMEHYANYDLEQITFRLHYNDYSWLAIGINLEGGHHMTNSYAIIGDIDRGVQFYWMTSEEEDASGVWLIEDVHNQITEKSFVQEDGWTTMQFTMNMAIADEDPEATIWHYVGEDSAFIWGAGLPDNQWAGVHSTLGFFSGLVPHDGCELKVQPTPNPTRSPTPAPVTVAAPVEAPVVVDAPSGQGIDDSNNSDGSTDGDADGDGTDNTNTSGSSGSGVGPGSSNLTPPSNPGPGPSSGTNGSSFNLVQGTTRASDETRALWINHGIFLGLAWGCFVPLAVGASYLKHNVSFLQNNARWLTLHFWFTVLATLCTLVGFILAVVAANQENEPTHFTKDTHHKVGLTIFLLVWIQCLAGYFRPSPPPKQDENGASSSDVDSPRSSTLHDDDGEDDDDDESDYTREQKRKRAKSFKARITHVDYTGQATVLQPEEESRMTKSSSGSSSAVPRKKKSSPLLRQFWEYFHRSLGMALLGLGWYNCTSGIQLQAGKYTQDDEQQLLKLFWGITGGIAGFVFFIGYVIRPKAKSNSAPSTPVEKVSC